MEADPEVEGQIQDLMGGGTRCEGCRRRYNDSDCPPEFKQLCHDGLASEAYHNDLRKEPYLFY